MRTKGLLNTSALIQSIIALACAAAVLAVWSTSFTRGDAPIKIAPRRDYAISNAAYFLQNDPEWAGDRLGESPYTMARSGCLVCCIASALTAQGMDTDPGRLNAVFCERGVYTEDGEIIWSKLTEALPVQAGTPSTIQPDKIEAMLERGICPIVKVKYLGYGYAHWVLILGGRDGEYLCMDPLDPGKAPQPLSVHGGTIYRWRTIDLIKN